MKRILLLLIYFIVLLSSASAVQVDVGVQFNTTGTGTSYFISTAFNATNITVYPTAWNINGGNITTYSNINMSMENLGDTSYLNFTNNATITNLTVTNNFANFTITPGLYTLYYQSNDTPFKYSVDVIEYYSIPAGSWYITSGMTPDPVTLTNTTYNFGVNYTWSPGSGANTDSYNVSLNSTWYNGSSQAWANNSTIPHGSIEIIVYAYNNSAGLSAGYLTDNVTLPNNPVTITNTSDWTDNEGQNVYVDYDSTDADSDTPTFSCNRTDLFTDFDPADGTGNWTTDFTDSGVYYVDFGVSDGYGSTSNYTMTITVNDHGTTGTPTNLQNTTGNFWVNYTWDSGINTDTFNVSQNGSWNNASSNTYINSSVGAHGWSNVSIAGYNSTSGITSASISDSVQLPNNAIVLSDVAASYTINEGETLSIDANYTDPDSDTGTFGDNSTEWNIDSSTGIVSWVTVDGDQGIYNYYINVSDGYGSTDTQAFSVTVIDATPTPVTGLASTTGNFWVNNTWASGSNTDSFNVSQNGTWVNGSTATFNNSTVGPHGWSNISVYGYNSTSGSLSTVQSLNTQVPNNAPVLSGIPNLNTAEDVNLTDIIDLDDYYTDIDGDSPTFTVDSNDQSLYVDIDISGTNTVDFLLALNWNGMANIVFKADDGYGDSDTDAMVLTVTAVNDSPVLDPIGSKSVYENETLFIHANATDPEGDTLTYSCDRLDLFTDFNSTTGEGNWTPDYTQAGIYYVDFGVSDGLLTDNESVKITVIDVPTLHIISYTPINNRPTNIPDESRTFSVTANEVCNITWYYNGILQQTNSSVDNALWTYTAVEGTYNVTAIANNVNGTDSQTWTWASNPVVHVPISLFLGLCIALIGTIVTAAATTGPTGILASMFGIMLAYINSKIVINGTLIQNIGGIDSVGNVVQGFSVIQVPALSYLFLFIAIIMTLVFILHLKNEILYQIEPEFDSELDF